jgi:hypothetical protein
MLNLDGKTSVNSVTKLGYFVADDGRSYIYAGGNRASLTRPTTYQGWWFST